MQCKRHARESGSECRKWCMVGENASEHVKWCKMQAINRSRCGKAYSTCMQRQNAGTMHTMQMIMQWVLCSASAGLILKIWGLIWDNFALNERSFNREDLDSWIVKIQRSDQKLFRLQVRWLKDQLNGGLSTKLALNVCNVGCLTC